MVGKCLQQEIEEILGCEDDGGDCEDMSWVETKGNANAAEKMVNVEKGIEIRMGKDTSYVPLLGVRIWEKLILEKE